MARGAHDAQTAGAPPRQPAAATQPAPVPAACPFLPLQALMKAQLQRIADTEGLSDNVFEIVSKSLKDA